MKLFERVIENYHNYIENAVSVKDVELECIFGSTHSKNPLTKKIFLSLIDKCRENYHVIEEDASLDIRNEFRNNVSNIRCTITGLDAIKQFCRDDTLENIDDDNITFLQKQYFKDTKNPGKKFSSLQDDNFNVRLNLKTEKPLMKGHRVISSFLSDFKVKRKHFRYKKRVSFLTIDKLFRIDLTVVKSTKYVRGRYDFHKSFREANILKNYEEYEMEIEYVGWKGKVGNDEIDELYTHFNDFFMPGPGKETRGNVYDPLNLGISIYENQEEEIVEQEMNYEFDSPRYTDNTVVKDGDMVEKYKSIIGKYVKIKDSYFNEVSSDLKLRDSLKDYYEKGVNLLIVKDLNEYEDSGIDAYVEFTNPIGGYTGLTVPVKYLYNIPTFSAEPSILYDDDDETSEKLPSRIPDEGEKEKTIKEIIRKVGHILENHVIDITKLIYNSDSIISYRLREEVIKKYKDFTEQRGRYFTLMVPQPVTLTVDYLKSNNPRSILRDYAVTEKADGERYQMIIIDHRGYLINSKQNVIDMNIYFENYENGWLFDGEYITKNKENQSIQLYKIFDIYMDEISNGKIIPQPIHTYPFISRNLGDISRSSVMQKFFTTMKIKRVNKDNQSITISLKEYEYGYLSKDGEDTNVKYEFSEDITGIFKATELILKREKEGYYNYRIDGLIYLPVRYSVRGSVEGLQSKNISGTWNYNFKWKPPEENTIDFLVKVKKRVEDSKVVESVIPMIEMNDGIKMTNDYKQIELYVGYDELEDETIDYCMLVMDGNKKKTGIQKEKIKLFNHNSEEDEKYNTSNIKLKNGKMVCLNHEEDEIKDGYLVEMRFNKDANNGCYWEPLRVRSDKQNPQYFTVANNVWSTILEPITEGMIQGNYDIKSIVGEEVGESGKYYVGDKETQYFASNGLRKLHNYIKSKLIIGICSSFKKPIKIMDLSFGQGGDVQKYINNSFVCNLFVGIDISSNIGEACKRFYSVNQTTKGVLFRADTSKNIRNGECSSIEGITEKERIHTETMISIIYGENKPITKEYQSIRKRYNSLAVSGFDVISSQFSMHYYFASKEIFNGFLTNLRDNIKKGGYFIGTCYDGGEIFNHFKENNDKMRKRWDADGEDSDDSDDSDDSEQYEEYKEFKFIDTLGNKVFSIEKKYEREEFVYDGGNEEDMFGNEIEVFMDSIGQPIVEYLVNFDFFTEVMKKNGFELVNPKGTTTNLFHNKYYENNLGKFHKVIENLPEIQKTDEVFRKFYGEAFEMNVKYTNSPLNILSSFNNYFTFRKV
mgnify:CR=1 FL=1|jgi:hypothetical protein